MYLYIYKYVYIYIYGFSYIWTCMHTYTYIYIYIYAYACIYPAAFGHPATVPAMFGWLVEWLISCLTVGCQHPPGWGQNAPTRWPNPIKMLPQILQNRSVGRSWGPLLGVLGALGELLEGLGAILATRWPQDGPERPKNLEKTILGPPLGSQVGGQNLSKIHPEAIEKVILFADTFGIDFKRGSPNNKMGTDECTRIYIYIYIYSI